MSRELRARSSSGSPCPRCGSARAKKTLGGECLDAKGCRVRRCARREAASDVVRREGRLVQCSSLYGTVRSFRFCTLHTGHEGLHLNGGTEWDDAGALGDPGAVTLGAAVQQKGGAS